MTIFAEITEFSTNVPLSTLERCHSLCNLSMNFQYSVDPIPRKLPSGVLLGMVIFSDVFEKNEVFFQKGETLADHQHTWERKTFFFSLLSSQDTKSVFLHLIISLLPKLQWSTFFRNNFTRKERQGITRQNIIRSKTAAVNLFHYTEILFSRKPLFIDPSQPIPDSSWNALQQFYESFQGFNIRFVKTMIATPTCLPDFQRDLDDISETESESQLLDDDFTDFTTTIMLDPAPAAVFPQTLLESFVSTAKNNVAIWKVIIFLMLQTNPSDHLTPAVLAASRLVGMNLFSAIRSLARGILAQIQARMEERLHLVTPLVSSAEKLRMLNYVLFFENNHEKGGKKRSPSTLMVPLPAMIFKLLTVCGVHFTHLTLKMPRFSAASLTGIWRILELQATKAAWPLGQAEQGDNWVVDSLLHLDKFLKTSAAQKEIDFSKPNFSLVVWEDAATAQSHSHTTGTVQILDHDRLLFPSGSSGLFPRFDGFFSEAKIPLTCLQAVTNELSALSSLPWVRDVIFKGDNSTLASATGAKKSGSHYRCAFCGVDVTRWHLELHTWSIDSTPSTLQDHANRAITLNCFMQQWEDSQMRVSNRAREVQKRIFQLELGFNKDRVPTLAQHGFSTPEILSFFPATMHNFGHLSWTVVDLLDQCVVTKRIRDAETFVASFEIRTLIDRVRQRCLGTSLSRLSYHTKHVRQVTQHADLIYRPFLHVMYLALPTALSVVNWMMWSRHVLSNESLNAFLPLMTGICLMAETIHHAVPGPRAQGGTLKTPSVLTNLYVHNIIVHTFSTMCWSQRNNIPPIFLSEEFEEHTHIFFHSFVQRFGGKFLARQSIVLRLLQFALCQLKKDYGWDEEDAEAAAPPSIPNSLTFCPCLFDANRHSIMRTFNEPFFEKMKNEMSRLSSDIKISQTGEGRQICWAPTGGVLSQLSFCVCGEHVLDPRPILQEESIKGIPIPEKLRGSRMSDSFKSAGRCGGESMDDEPEEDAEDGEESSDDSDSNEEEEEEDDVD